MSFGEYAIGLTGMYILYYSVVIATDMFKHSKMQNEKNSEDKEINISQAVEQYTPIDASAVIEKEEASGYDEEDVLAGIDEPPADDTEEEEEEKKNQNPNDITVNNHEGIPAFRFKELISDIAQQQTNLFEGCLSTDGASL